MKIQIEDVAAVGALVRRHPTLIALFEQLEIDYACKSGRTLRDAANRLKTAREEQTT